jgi:hypothetical protein
LSGDATCRRSANANEGERYCDQPEQPKPVGGPVSDGELCRPSANSNAEGECTNKGEQRGEQHASGYGEGAGEPKESAVNRKRNDKRPPGWMQNLLQDTSNCAF